MVEHQKAQEEESPLHHYDYHSKTGPIEHHIKHQYDVEKHAKAAEVIETERTTDFTH